MSRNRVRDAVTETGNLLASSAASAAKTLKNLALETVTFFNYSN